MDMTILFATPVGVAKHPDLAKAVVPMFAKDELFRKALDGSNGDFWTTMYAYDAAKPSAVLSDPTITKIKKAIKLEASVFFAGLGYDADNYDFKVTNLWMNRMRSGSSHRAHSHHGHTISGCFYVKVPQNANIVEFTGPLQSINKASPAIRDMTIFNSIYWNLAVADGDMVFWESYLRHSVPTSTFDGERLSMAFDVDATYKDTP